MFDNIASTPVGFALEVSFRQAGRHEDALRSLYIGRGVVEATLLTRRGQSSSICVKHIDLLLNFGVKGDSHARSGGQSQVDSREDVLRMVAGIGRGTPMANLRQVTLVSAEESNGVAAAMGLPGGIMPSGLQGENLVISGVPHLSRMPRGAIILFHDPETGSPRGVSLHVIAANNPCGHPHANIVSHLESQEAPKPLVAYKKAAEGRRGLVAVIKTGGLVYPGDVVTIWEHN